MSSFSAKSVVFVTYPGVKLLDLTGPLQVFADADAGYDITIASLSGGTVPSDTVLPVQTSTIHSLQMRPIDTLIVVGGAGAHAACEDQALLDAIRMMASRARRVASVCTGAFVLAAAGLLAGRAAVTHWESCARLQEAYPDIDVTPDAIFVRDGNVLTSAGVTAGIDMCLDMVAEDIGRKAALELARSLVCYLVRPGGQSQFSRPLQQQTQSASCKFDPLNAWITENLGADLSVDALAARVSMSPRNFARLYRQHAGVTPAKAVESFRVEAACRLLEETDLPLISIAARCGFYDDERLRRAMIRERGVAPGEYRQRFGAEHTAALAVAAGS